MPPMANDYEIDGAADLLRQTHAKLLAHEHRKDRVDAAKKLLAAVHKALEQSGWCPLRHDQGQVVVSHTSKGVRTEAVLFVNEEQGMLLLGDADVHSVDLPRL